MDLKDKYIDYLVLLGKRIQQSDVIKQQVAAAESRNPWFIEAFVQKAVDAITGFMLNESKLKTWLGKYDLKVVNKRVGVVFAGNIPLVGFHDFLCCYVAGCQTQIKLSSKDDALFVAILNLLFEIDPAAKDRIKLVETLKDFDAVIATGSDNTNRHFEYYFRNYPKILRKNRNSIAILSGKETAEELRALADDIFMYFGFGCRNVSKLYVPEGYDVTTLFPHFEAFKWLHQHGKYMNNYDYNRTLLLLNKTPHYANEFVSVIENESIPSPISNLHYQFYNDIDMLEAHLQANNDKIQCRVSADNRLWASVSFGDTQQPELWEYADGVDTLQFLLGL